MTPADRPPLRVLLVDDQRLMREGLRILLELESDIRVVAEAEHGQQALQAFEEHRPDVVLMDIRMPVMDGVEATRRLLNDHPEAKVLILTTFDDDAYVLEGLRAGALGYLLKDASREELTAAIRTVAAGGALFSPQVARKALDALHHVPIPPPPHDLIEPLTDREREILRLVAQGLSNRQIAERLHLAHGTVKNYISRILDKLGVTDRTQAALWAREHGFD